MERKLIPGNLYLGIISLLVLSMSLMAAVESAEQFNESGTLKCPSTHVACDDGSRCIPTNYECDHDFDCDDHSDEKNCSGCELGKINCPNSPQCIWSENVCDGYPDCPDQSDELNCDSCSNSSLQYKCEHGMQCINLTSVCDGVADCDDESDEGIECGAMCGNKKCQSPSYCKPTPRYSVCICPGGHHRFEIGSKVFCQEVNECNSTDEPKCSHICVNEPPGSFTCSCRPGYVLLENKYCRVKAGVPEAQLVFETRDQIRSFSLESKNNVLIISVPHDIWDLAIGPLPQENVYWTDVKNHAVYGIPRSSVNATFQQSMVRINYGLLYPVGITIDWKANIMYIADSGRKELIACSPTGRTCTIIQKDLYKPRSLTIDPDTRELYWTDWSSPAKIEKSWLDGTNRSIFLTMSQSYDHPFAIVVDRTIERLFWVDERYNKIESIKLDGTDRKKIYRGGNYQIFGVAVFEDRIFWSDAGKMNIMTAHKFIGQYASTLIKAAPKPRVLKIAHPYLYSAESILQTDNACQLVECDGLCLQSNNAKGYTCSCPPDHVVSDTGCHRNLFESQLYFSADKIYNFPLNSIGLRSLLTQSITSAAITDADVIDVDPITNQIVFADNKNHRIAVVELDNNMATEKTLYTMVGEVNGIAVDWVARNVYWTDATNDTVQVARLDGMAQMTLLAFAFKPMAIAVDMLDGFVYFSESTSHNSAALGQIVKCQADSSDTILVRNAGFANGIVIDQASRRLFWTDSYNIGIFSVLLDGESETSHWRGGEGVPFSLAIDGSLLYWTDKKSNVIRSMDKDNKNSVKELLKQDGLKSITIWNKQKLKQIQHNCTSNNGGCSHLCLRMMEQRVCRCPKGLQLQNDQVTCLTEPKLTSPVLLVSPTIHPNPTTSPADLVMAITPSHSFRHVCPKGYKLIQNGSCIDVDECAVNYRLCSQRCDNQPGHYECQCVQGYLMDSRDRKNCKADQRDYPLSYVIVADGGKLWKVFAETEKSDVTPEASLSPISIFDVDSYNKHIIYVQKNSLLEYDPVRHKTSIIAESLSGQVEDIALDWIGQNIYYLNSHEIGLCQRYTKQMNCRVLFNEDLLSPKGIAVCPCKGLMFWSDMYLHRIESAWMDGSNRKVIVKNGMVASCAITVDMPAQRIYWVDQHESTIESAKLDGSQRLSIPVELQNSMLLSIAVFENLLYITDVDRSLAVVNKLDGLQRVAETLDFTEPKIVRVVHQLKQMRMKDTCLDAECSQLCLISPLGKTCACGDGFAMADDNKTCLGIDTTTENNQKFASECKNCTNGGSCILKNEEYICVCPLNFTGPGCLNRVPVNTNAALTSEHKNSNSAWIAGPVVCVLIFIAVITAVALYCRSGRNKRKRSLSQMIRFHANIVLRKEPEPDREELVSEAMDNPSYQEYEDLNYPKEKMGWSISTSSIDSAFASKQGRTSQGSASTHSSSCSEN